MIAAYQGKADGSAGRASPSTPLRLWRKPLRGFGGMTAQLDRAKDAAMPFEANPMLRQRRMMSR
jgi:hypothetical protein